MYKKFYGVTKNPFEISPDPYFFHGTPRHLEALANLYYGVRREKGFIVVTGEVGTGKTLLIRCLMKELAAGGVNFAYVFNPLLEVDDFLNCILHDLGISGPLGSKGQMLMALNEALLKSHNEGKITALIIDESQNLSSTLLEEIRLLTNLETSDRKLLQVVLVGQPELDLKLDSPNLRQLKQRIALRCALRPFDEVESRAYVVKRLERAGAIAGALPVFTPAALQRIHSNSRGIPRLINVICENALISGYARQIRTVTADMIDEVAKDLRLDVEAAPLAKDDGSEIAEAKGLIRSLMKLIKTNESDATRPLNLGGIEK